MSQLNLIIGPAQLQEYDDEKEKEEERQRKQRLLKAYEDKFKASGKQQETAGFIFRRLFVCCSCSNVHGEDALDITCTPGVLQSEGEQRGESYWYSVTASLVTRIVENIEVDTQRDV